MLTPDLKATIERDCLLGELTKPGNTSDPELSLDMPVNRFAYLLAAHCRHLLAAVAELEAWRDKVQTDLKSFVEYVLTGEAQP